MSQPEPAPFVSRGGLKLSHALAEFGLDPAGLVCADLGCSTGGFTDCLLRAGAARVYAVDTAYGQLAWKLRQDPRVVVIERTNALHAEPPAAVDLVVIDLGWTPQRLAVPAAVRWLKTDAAARIISLIKPHYERSSRQAAGRGRDQGGGGGRRGHGPVVLPEPEAERIAHETAEELAVLGLRVLGLIRSPILGGAGGRSKGGTGNAEWLVLLERSVETSG